MSPERPGRRLFEAKEMIRTKPLRQECPWSVQDTVRLPVCLQGREARWVQIMLRTVGLMQAWALLGLRESNGSVRAEE